MKTGVIQTITATDMRAINRSAILELIRAAGPISRSEIGLRLQVSLPTVMRIIDELAEEGLVRPTGAKEWSGGRKRSLVEFNASANLVIGVDLGGTKLYGAVADLNGNILQESHIAHHGTRGEESFTRLCDLIDELLEFVDTYPERNPGSPAPTLRGIGVGVPGVTVQETGLAKTAPSLGWEDFPLRQRLCERYNRTVIIENDVNLAAVGEYCFGGHAGVKDLVLIAIGTGIGAGIIINGRVYSGAHFMAGEIGYFLLDRVQLGQAYPGFGAFEQLASGTGIAARARRLLQGQLSLAELEALDTEDIFAAARRQEAWALPVLAETVDYLAQAIAAINQLLDPDLILLGGGVARSADLLIDPILERLRGTAPILPRLEATRLGYRAAVLGSVAQVLQVTSNFYWIQKYS